MNDVCNHTITNAPSLSQIAENIAAISRNMSHNALENAILLGEQYSLARDDFPQKHGTHSKAHRPGWHEWIQRETPWTRAQAISFIRVYERSREQPELWVDETGCFITSLLPLQTLFKIASPDLSPEYRSDLVKQIADEKLSADRVAKLLKAKRSNGAIPSRPKRMKRGRERFKNAIRTACQLCETACELPIPLLYTSELTALISELEEAKGHVGRMLSELKGDLK